MTATLNCRPSVYYNASVVARCYNPNIHSAVLSPSFTVLAIAPISHISSDVVRVAPGGKYPRAATVSSCGRCLFRVRKRYYCGRLICIHYRQRTFITSAWFYQRRNQGWAHPTSATEGRGICKYAKFFEG